MNTLSKDYRAGAAQLFNDAKKELAEDMKNRGIGMILWDLSSAGFHYVPEILHRSQRKGTSRIARIEGLYLYNGEIYLIEEDRAPVSIDQFYNPDTEVPPTVVTLSEDAAVKTLGDPEATKGYTQQGSLEEWLAIADCYFEALNEK